MKKFLLLIITILITMCFSIPVLAEEPGMHGELSCKYELLNYNPGQEWTVDVHYNFLEWLSIGALQTTYTDDFYSISFAPTNQYYDIYCKIEFNKISIQVGQWCNHPVMSFDNETFISVPKSEKGIYIMGGYKF